MCTIVLQVPAPTPGAFSFPPPPPLDVQPLVPALEEEPLESPAAATAAASAAAAGSAAMSLGHVLPPAAQEEGQPVFSIPYADMLND